MTRILLILLFAFSSLLSFETTNLQLLYSNNFKGDAFIYDTKDGKKTTVTFEHFRTFEFGDMFMFIDKANGEKFDGATTDMYSEISPRFSLLKLSNAELSVAIVKDFYIATQLNVWYDYIAYLGGLGVDIEIPGFNFVNVNLYYKDESIYSEPTFQVSSAYQSKSYYNIHIEGFIDITKRDINTQNQLLYNLQGVLHTKEQFYLGTEWLYYNYSYKGSSAYTSVVQAMLKYKF